MECCGVTSHFAAPPAPMLADPSLVIPSAGDPLLTPAAGRRQQLSRSGCTAGCSPQIVPLCAPYLSCVGVIMQLFKSLVIMMSKYLPGTAPAQHVAPWSHPHAGCPEAMAGCIPPGSCSPSVGDCPPDCCLLGSHHVPLQGLLEGLVQSWGAAVPSTLPTCFPGRGSSKGGIFWLGSVRLLCWLWFRDPILVGCHG